LGYRYELTSTSRERVGPSQDKERHTTGLAHLQVEDR